MSYLTNFTIKVNALISKLIWNHLKCFKSSIIRTFKELNNENFLMASNVRRFIKFEKSFLIWSNFQIRIKFKSRMTKIADAIAQWFHPAAPGLNPKYTI